MIDRDLLVEYVTDVFRGGRDAGALVDFFALDEQTQGAAIKERASKMLEALEEHRASLSTAADVVAQRIAGIQKGRDSL